MMTRLATCAVMFSAAWCTLAGADAPATQARSGGAAKPVDLVICLDTSGSMDGLINAARTKLWAIVSDLALARPAPRLRVALLSYGNDGNAAADGWVKIEAGFTEDLDLVSQKLFALTTNGGTELVARVLKTGVEQLSWDASPAALKLMFVAGNESAEQDQQLSLRDVCKQAIEHGIVVNSIYCAEAGAAVDQIAPKWREIAALADGQFAAIDQENGTVVIATPFDAELNKLNLALNDTYIPIGAAGEAGRANQVAQDSNALSLNREACSSRAVAKASALYSCSWDLIDALRSKQVKLEEVKATDLPAPMQSMTIEQRQAHVDAKAKQRSEVQKAIQDVDRKRQEFIAAELKQLSNDQTKAFDVMVRKAVRAQATAKGFSFGNP
ncbi:MAG: vWA domain-containing protein [Planctomycetota bacterium]